MDSLSQIVLGAAVGELMLGKRLGNKAQLIGAIGGTIPDLDVLSNPFIVDEIAKLTIHRGYSHSMFIQLLMALPFAALTKWIFKEKIPFKEWYLVWYLLFLTHTLLDCCTTYGTQLFLPFTDYLVGFNNISVVDPFWTVPFMLLLGVCLFMKRANPKRIKWAWISVIYATLYMGYTFVNKGLVHQHFAAELKQKNMTYDELSTTPSIFNNWLWSGIAIRQDSIFVAEYSVLQNSDEVDWIGYPRNLELLENHPAKRELGVLKWFSQDRYFVEQVDNQLRFYLVKWGRPNFDKSASDADEAFVFYWILMEESDGHWYAHQYQKSFGKDEFKLAWQMLWKRVLEKP